MVRLWVNDIDYGTMTEKAAQAYISEDERLFPGETYRIETVADDAATFLSELEGR